MGVYGRPGRIVTGWSQIPKGWARISGYCEPPQQARSRESKRGVHGPRQVLKGFAAASAQWHRDPLWFPAHFRHAARGGPVDPASVARPASIVDVPEFVTALEPRVGEMR